MGNDAFISYSHAADGALAPALEQGMQRLARPWYRVRALSVFRDHSDLAVTPHLWETIRLTLDGSRYLVALLSPESAASKWVNKELTYWCAERGTSELLLVLTGGELTWDETIGDFSAASTAVPAGSGSSTPASRCTRTSAGRGPGSTSPSATLRSEAPSPALRHRSTACPRTTSRARTSGCGDGPGASPSAAWSRSAR